jgi:hypothetical protein
MMTETLHQPDVLQTHLLTGMGIVTLDTQYAIYDGRLPRSIRKDEVKSRADNGVTLGVDDVQMIHLIR